MTAFRRTAAIALLASTIFTGRAAAQDAEEPPPGEDYLRAALWELACLAGGTIWYWLDDRNIVDWDFDSWEDRFSEEAYRFDNNEFPINFIGHPLSGAAYYGLPRANGLSVPAAFGFGLFTSFVWEFVLEFQERFSLNDIITTPIGGMPSGEFFVRLGRYLDQNAHPALAWTLGFPVAIHELADGRAIGTERPPRQPTIWHRFELKYGAGWSMPSDAPGFDLQEIGGRGTLIAIRGYATQRDAFRVFYDAEFAAMDASAFFGSTGAGFDMWSDTILFGMHWQHVTGGDAADPIGTVLLVGTGISHSYRFEQYDAWSDRFSTVGLSGLAVEATEGLGPLTVHLRTRIQPAFGAAHVAAYGAFQAANPEAQTKTILERHGFQYAFGWTLRGELEVRTQWLAVGVAGVFSRLDSQEGFDRWQEEVAHDTDGRETLIDARAWARLQLPYGLFVEASLRSQRRLSELEEITVDRELLRAQGAVGLEL